MRENAHELRYELILLRLRAGLKQYQLAQLLGVPQTALCDWERGRRPVSPEVAQRIREALATVRPKETAYGCPGDGQLEG